EIAAQEPEMPVGQECLVRVRPAALELHGQRPAGPNSFAATVRWLEPAEGGARVRLAGEVELVAHVDLAAADPHWLSPGAQVWVQVPPDEVQVGVARGENRTGVGSPGEVRPGAGSPGDGPKRAEGGEVPTGPARGEGPRRPAGGEGPTGPAGGEGPTGPAGGEGPTGPAGGEGPTGPAGCDQEPAAGSSSGAAPS